jgi:hypothetical protein
MNDAACTRGGEDEATSTSDKIAITPADKAIFNIDDPFLRGSGDQERPRYDPIYLCKAVVAMLLYLRARRNANVIMTAR